MRDRGDVHDLAQEEVPARPWGRSCRGRGQHRPRQAQLANKVDEYSAHAGLWRYPSWELTSASEVTSQRRKLAFGPSFGGRCLAGPFLYVDDGDLAAFRHDVTGYRGAQTGSAAGDNGARVFNLHFWLPKQA